MHPDGLREVRTVCANDLNALKHAYGMGRPPNLL